MGKGLWTMDQTGGVQFDDADFPFDQYQRYATVADLVSGVKHTLGWTRCRLLDVGGFFRLASGRIRLPICTALPDDDLFVVDMAAGDRSPYIRASGMSLPFRDASFDIVVSCDTLEHVPSSDRAMFIRELARVSRRYVIVAAPMRNENTEQAERIVSEFIRLRLGGPQLQLLEHASLGLPRSDEVVRALERAGLKAVSFPCEDLYGWLLMMLAKHYLLSLPGSEALHSLVDHFYITNFPQGALPERAADRAYRRFFVASKCQDDPFINGLRQAHEEQEANLAWKTDAPALVEPPLSVGLSQLLASLALHERLTDQVSQRLSTLENALNQVPRARQTADWSQGGLKDHGVESRFDTGGTEGARQEKTNLAAKAWLVLRHQGLIALGREVRSYARWRFSSQAKL